MIKFFSFKSNSPIFILGFIIAMLFFTSVIGFAQSAIRQLETITGKTIDRSSGSSTTSDYAANRQASAEYRQNQKEARQQQKLNYGIELNQAGINEYTLKNWEEAIKYFKKAVRNSPNDGVIRNNLKNAEDAYAQEKTSKKLQEETAKSQREYEEKQRKWQEEEKNKEMEQQQALDKAGREAMEKKLNEAQQKIFSLQKDISGIQQSLKVYSKSLYNNTAEFEKWSNTVDVAYKNVLENTREEIKGYFIKYALLAAFGPATQKLAFNKIRSIIQSNDPQMQKWLAVEAKLKGITPDKVEDLIDKVNKGFELNDLLQGDQSGIKPKLDAMLFVHSLFETFNMYDYKTLMEKEKFFGSAELAGEYFDKAKLIGETYTDLTSICYSWFMINKLTTDNEAFTGKINTLSFNMQYEMKQVDCLKKCMKDYSKGCIEQCTGVTRFSTPPPLIR